MSSWEAVRLEVAGGGNPKEAAGREGMLSTLQQLSPGAKDPIMQICEVGSGVALKEAQKEERKS